MVTIVRIPKKLTTFFRGVERNFSQPAYRHFWGLVLAIAISSEHTLLRLCRLLRWHPHRTRQGTFLWQSEWNESTVLQELALDTLKRLHRPGARLYFILDDTQVLKRAKRMEAVGRLRHHASGKFGDGHTILKVCLWYRGVIIPWGSWLYVKKEHAPKLKIPFVKLTELAGSAIRQANLPNGMNITVLFDAYYLCRPVIQAVNDRKWHYIGASRLNRWFHIRGHSRQFKTYARNVLRRSGKAANVRGLKSTRRYRIARRIGTLNKVGEVNVVFSHRPAEVRDLIVLVTNDLSRSARNVLADYLHRWAIELLIKEEKQHLGLGAYRVKRYRAVVRHLHLVDSAYACLTHLGINSQGAQGNTKSKGLLQLPPVSKLKGVLQQMIWREAVKDVVKGRHDKVVIKRIEALMAA